MENNTEKKKVFVYVPYEKITDDAILDRNIQLTKRDYCKVRKVSPKDVIFYDYLHDLKPAIEAVEENEMIKKHEGLGDVGYIISMIEAVDDVILGLNWSKSRSGKVVAKTCDVFMVPHIRMMKNEERKTEIEDNPATLDYRNKHNITVVWKEFKKNH